VVDRVTEYRFSGRERVTFELAGSFEPGALAVPDGLEHDDPGGGRVVLFGFAVEGLRIRGVPLARWSYPELLWRIAVRRVATKEAAWWVVACDLGARGPRWAARRYVRYDVRAQIVEVTEQRVASRGPAGELVLALAATPSAPSPPLVAAARPLLVGQNAGWQVPWGEDDTPAVEADVHVERDSLALATIGAPVRWAARGTLRRGRQHRCGVARR
jgi:hypothetical protein